MLIDPKWMRFYARMSGAVLGKFALMMLGFFAGSALDKKFGTYPVCLFLGVTVALSIGIAGIVWIAEKESARLSKESPEKEDVR